MTAEPTIGDLVALPAWLPRLPYRVLGVEPLLIPGWVRLRGYLIVPDLAQQRATYLVPVDGLRKLPDPAWDRDDRSEDKQI